MANKYLFDDLLLFMSGEGDEATSPSVTDENSGIDGSSALLEASIPTQQMPGGMRTGAVYPRQTNTYLLIFYFLRAETATRQRRHLLQLKIRGLMFPARCWKRSSQHSTCSGGCEWERFTHGKQIPVCRSFTFYERRERRGNVALFWS